MLALGLLVGRGEAQSCTQKYGGAAHCEEDKSRMAGRRPKSPVTPGGDCQRAERKTRRSHQDLCQQSVSLVFGMLVIWTWMLALALLAGRGEAQSCTQVFGGPNLARGRPTSQSSTYSHTDGITGISSYAVDGNCDGRWISRSCTHTNQELSPWWSVDLGQRYDISVVVVKIRQDCCGERTRGATIHVGDHMGDFSRTSVICGTITDLRDGSLSTVLCNGARGRYVTIAIKGHTTILSLGEVEVHGTRSGKPY
ncbi:UNVERIFIED_CONTAM: hypothetical protein K2H54_002382 [Gekko kuhli]